MCTIKLHIYIFLSARSCGVNESCVTHKIQSKLPTLVIYRTFSRWCLWCKKHLSYLSTHVSSLKTHTQIKTGPHHKLDQNKCLLLRNHLSVLDTQTQFAVLSHHKFLNNWQCNLSVQFNNGMYGSISNYLNLNSLKWHLHTLRSGMLDRPQKCESWISKSNGSQ